MWVTDQLDTHHPASLYEAFTPAEARRLARRLEVQPPPRHGSWWNLAEIERAILARPCLDRRLPSPEASAAEATAWQRERNAAQPETDWRVTTADARLKLPTRAYPVWI